MINLYGTHTNDQYTFKPGPKKGNLKKKFKLQKKISLSINLLCQNDQSINHQSINYFYYTYQEAL